MIKSAIVIAAVLVAMLAANPIGAQARPAIVEATIDTEIESFTGEEMLLVGASRYAEMFGVSIEEAIERQNLRNRFGPLLMRLQTQHPQEFAAVKIVHSPEYEFVIYLVGSGGNAINAVVDTQDVEPNMPLRVVLQAPLSAVRLQDQADRLHNALVQAGVTELTTGFDGRTGEVLVTLRADAGIPQFNLPLEARATNVIIDARVGSIVEEHHTYGGALTGTVPNATSGCTTGFVVVQGSTRGVSTAGHCGNARWYSMGAPNDYEITFKAQHKGEWGDFQWHTTPHTEFDDFYWDWNSRGDITGVQAGSNMAPGDLVCFFGRTSGPSCDIVLATSITSSTGGNLYEQLVATLGYKTAGGDSGGPWYYGGTAWGIHRGANYYAGGSRSVFSKAALIDEALGVQIATS